MDNNSANSLLFSTLQLWYSLTQWESGGVFKMIGSNNQSDFTAFIYIFQLSHCLFFPLWKDFVDRSSFFFYCIYFSCLVPCLPGINQIILIVGNFTTLSLFCAVEWHEMWEGESVDFQRCPWNHTAGIYQSILQYKTDWLCLDCVLCIAPSKKHWKRNRIRPSLNIWIQVETFMGNYINTLVSWVPSKYLRSCCWQLDKTYFRAVVRKVT